MDVKRGDPSDGTFFAILGSDSDLDSGTGSGTSSGTGSGTDAADVVVEPTFGKAGQILSSSLELDTRRVQLQHPPASLQIRYYSSYHSFELSHIFNIERRGALLLDFSEARMLIGNIRYGPAVDGAPLENNKHDYKMLQLDDTCKNCE
ncbi:hypothetical protein HHK36_021104 [Tetracentron sinense]|uniref:Uncharacterized protein n=1 Tax=Tetracentron sinense TaxID=13715 RepID=A0A834YTB2_TETSI|nr:hypothetical protein HHK36_021104 [Tetracentron sinense]